MIEIKARGNRKQYKKFPRTTINNKGGDRKATKVVMTDWYNGYRYDYVKVERFLHSNIGRPYNNILSELKGKLGKSVVKITPMEILQNNVYKSKDEVSERYGGFYWSNNILNYKKPKRTVVDYNWTSKWKEYYTYNNENFPTKKDLYIISKQADRDGIAPIGRFYVNYQGNTYFTTVYLVPNTVGSYYPKVALIGEYDHIGVSVYSTHFNRQVFRPWYIVEWYTKYHNHIPPYVFVAKKLSDKQKI